MQSWSGEAMLWRRVVFLERALLTGVSPGHQLADKIVSGDQNLRGTLRKAEFGPPTTPCTAVLCGLPMPMLPLAILVHMRRLGGMSAALGHRGHTWGP